MLEKREAPFGSWKSLITPDLIVAETISLGQIVLDGSQAYWTEGRPSEGGRSVIVRLLEDGGKMDMTPPPYNVRTRVHEYGGGSYIVKEGVIFFCNFSDQRLYRYVPGQEPQAVTPADNLRYADGVFAGDGRLVCVREDHRQEGVEAVNTLVSLSLDGEDPGRVLVSGNDFYSSPRFSPDGRQLVWLTWNHPNMPWDGTELWMADYQPDGSLSNARLIAGGMEESIFQPEWSPDGVLHFISDRSGWWNLYCYDGDTKPLYPLQADCGLPQWEFGRRSYSFISDHQILLIVFTHGQMSLQILDKVGGVLQPLNLPFTYILAIQSDNKYAYVGAGSPNHASGIYRLDLQTKELQLLQRSSDLKLAEDDTSVLQPISFPTGNGLTAYGFYYPPRSGTYHGPEGDRPPLIITIHGGPTEAAIPVFRIGIQYWTNRGFAVLDVNYGGSTGFGREYRQRLQGQWGIVDVQDCINGAKYFVEQGLVDEDKIAIRGGSAGGYTTLRALTSDNTFKAGASYFGISDIEALAKEAHKFESRYLDKLIAPYPEGKKLYMERSPIYSVDQINSPVIFFQGLEDKVVPPNQSEIMFNAVKAKGVPTAYLPFAGEQHGFRRAENIKRSLEAEYYFYARVFVFPPADDIEPVLIENL